MTKLRLPWPALIGAGGLAVIAAVALAVVGTQHPRPALPLAPLADLGRLSPAPAAGTPGPEGVPVPAGPSLAPPQPRHAGEEIDGISCQTGEQAAFHIHAHLRIVVRGRSRQVPAGIGIAPPHQVAATPAGRFVAGGACFMWLHTHAADGVVHVESPADRTYTLGELFDIWGQPLTRGRVGPARGIVTAVYDGGVFTGNLRTIPLLAHSRIELEVGRPLVVPEGIGFPGGL
jgi:hypothetical protein